MSRIPKSLTWLGFFFLVLSLSSAAPGSRETIIYVVRHAEKDVSDAKNNDPELSAEGKQRAKDLAQLLKKEKLAAVYSTDYNRTKQTVASLAQQNGVPVKTYDSKKPDEIARLVKTEHKGQKILMAGHSNTILELVKAFGPTPPFDKLEDDDYDLIFTIAINKDGKASLTTRRFGQSHHSTKLPETKSAY